MTVSDVARFQQQQAMQEEAARQGLHGLASNFSSHEFNVSKSVIQKVRLSDLETSKHPIPQRKR